MEIMTNKSDIASRLNRGEWYSFSPDHPVRWKVIRVYSDGSIAKVYHDIITGETGRVRSPIDAKFPRLVKYIEQGLLCFIQSTSS